MAVPSSGAISLLGIKRELSNNDYSASNTHSNISLKDCSDGTVATINTANASTDRPDGDAPHFMTEFYAYDHDLVTLSTITNKYSFLLDGVDEYIDLGEDYHTIGSDNCTVMGWIRPDNLTGNVEIFSIGENTGSRFRMQRRSNKVGAYIESDTHSGGQALNGSTTIAVDTWYHVALVKSGTTFTIYLNGSSDGSLTQTGDFSSSTGIIGAYWGGGSNFFAGRVDEMALFDYAVSSSDIYNIYDVNTRTASADLDELTTPPIAWYRMGD